MEAIIVKGSALASLAVRRHARHMRHASSDDLDRVEDLLMELRKLSQLRERKRGSFSRGAHAFLHFHEDSGDIYVDVKLDKGFQRLPLRNPGERTDFLFRVRAALGS